MTTYNLEGEKTRFFYEQGHTPEQNIAWLVGYDLSTPEPPHLSILRPRTVALYLLGTIIS